MNGWRESLKEPSDSMERQRARPQRSVSITEHVLASIAGMAASNVEGVSSLRGNVTENLKVFLGDERGRRGVIARVQDNDVSVTLDISVEYGYPIQDVARTLQTQVKREIEGMTGLHVTGVHVYVSDLTLPAGSWPNEDGGSPEASEAEATGTDRANENDDEATSADDTRSHSVSERP